MSLTDKTVDEGRKTKIENLLKKLIVVLPEGNFKLTQLKKEAAEKYEAEFLRTDGLGKVFSNEKLNFRMICTYNLDFDPDFESPLIITDRYFHRYSYTNGRSKTPIFYLEILSNKNHRQTKNHVKEFFINFAKMQQNEINESLGEPENYELNFSILENENICF